MLLNRRSDFTIQFLYIELDCGKLTVLFFAVIGQFAKLFNKITTITKDEFHDGIGTVRLIHKVSQLLMTSLFTLFNCFGFLEYLLIIIHLIFNQVLLVFLYSCFRVFYLTCLYGDVCDGKTIFKAAFQNDFRKPKSNTKSKMKPKNIENWYLSYTSITDVHK